MGSSPTKPVAAKPASRAQVTLHVYDAIVRADFVACNRALFRLAGAGAFHTGVEVYNREWSYRKTKTEGTGVFCHAPLKPPAASHYQSVSMGTTELQMDTVYRLIDVLAGEWPGTEYDLLEKNCVTFCREFLKHLFVGVPFPTWVSKLSDTGLSIRNDGRDVAEAMAGCRKTLATKLQTTGRCLGDDVASRCFEPRRRLCCHNDDDECTGSTVQVIRESQMVEEPGQPDVGSRRRIIGL